SLDAARGTVVHGILEKLFDLPAPGRTMAAATELVEPQWGEMLADDAEPAEREVLVETSLPSGIRLKGFVDRLDRAVDGRLRVVDYKTGKSPREEFEGKALFQL